MGRNVIEVEHVSKLYRLGQVGTGTLSQDMSRFIARVRGKEDPTLKLGETNDRTAKSNSEYSWALRDVSFNVKEGEVLGIIGRNGAGKSTLLKLLSRVSLPTEGNIRMRGRMASLLEVGTGFHPELTGRENVFLNGAVMGMRKVDIKAKFDEIVAFAGVERYIDTPVKRYSSGMYVRLAFAVAAHLNPDILVIDEVLAVGDVEFQKKCLGKMQDVSRSGRTILFVSHNMTAVNNLCSRCLLIDQGNVRMDGPSLEVINAYFEMNSAKDDQGRVDHSIVPEKWDRPWGRRGARFQRVQLLNTDQEQTNEVAFLDPFHVRISFLVEEKITGAKLQLRIANQEGQQITFSDSFYDTGKLLDLEVGEHTMNVAFDPRLMPGTYCFFIYLSSAEGTVFYDGIPNFGKFTVSNMSKSGLHYLSDKVNTFIQLPCTWQLKSTE